jgi:hypothetical protein
MSRRLEKHTLSSRSRFLLCAIALAWGCHVAPSQTAQSGAYPDPALQSTRPLESTLSEDGTELAACKLELDCCGNLNCAPAPCPIVCL